MLPNLFHLHVLSYQLISYLCIIQMSDVRHFYSIPAPSQYGCNPFFQHQTGDDVASCSLASRLSLSSERSPISWFARHCSSKVSHGYFCSWVLLAWSQGMQKIHGSQIELRFLGGKVRRNKERDQEVWRQLEAKGWFVIIVWECQLRKSELEETIRRMEEEIYRNGERYRQEKEDRSKICKVYREERRQLQEREFAFKSELGSYFPLK